MRFANKEAYNTFVKKYGKDAAAGGRPGGMRPPVNKSASISAPQPGVTPRPMPKPIPVKPGTRGPGGVGTTGFKSGSGGFASNLFGTGMKKGGKVKAVSAPKASSASKKADGLVKTGKTKGRFV